MLRMSEHNIQVARLCCSKQCSEEIQQLKDKDLEREIQTITGLHHLLFS